MGVGYGEGRRMKGGGVSERKLGVCNYCNSLGPVYEQEDEARPLFLVCRNCIIDVVEGISRDTKTNEKRKKSGLPPHLKWLQEDNS